MILLDTDHLTILTFRESEQYVRLRGRMSASSDQDFATTIVNAEELMRGWLAKINRLRTVHQQIPAYDRLGELLDFLADIAVIWFDIRAANEY